MSDNPFRKALEGDSVSAPATTEPAPAPVAPAAEPVVSSLESALAALPDDGADVPTLDDEDASAVASAETVEKDGAKREVVAKETFLKRVRSLTAKRRAAETALDSAKAEVEAVKAQIQAVKPVLGIAQRYRGKEHQLGWDVDFIDTFEALAKADPELQSVAQRIISTMKKKGSSVPTDVTRDTVTAPQPAPAAPAAAPAASQSELLVVTERVVNRDARRMLTEVLTEAGVEDRFVKAIGTAAMKDLTVAQRAELDSDRVLAYTKRYLKANELTAKDILKAVEPAAPAKPKVPTLGAQGKPAPNPKPATEPAKAETGPKFKTYEEYKERRRAGIRQLATELGMDS